MLTAPATAFASPVAARAGGGIAHPKALPKAAPRGAGSAAPAARGLGATEWAALVGTVAAATAGRKLKPGRAVAPGRSRAAAVVVRAAKADAIQQAAAELSKSTYPFMSEVPWNSTEFWLNPGAADPVSWAKAIGKIIDMGASMDAGLVKAGCDAHHAANAGLASGGCCSEAKLTEIYAAIGRMIASVPESKTMGVYDAIAPLVDAKVPEYLMSKVTEANARAAYAALMKFTEVVKANPIEPSTSATAVSSGADAAISAAAAKLGRDAYPFMQGVDWTDDVYAKTPPGKSAGQVLAAVDKMIAMGSKMDGPALQEAARAHVAAIENMDAKGVLTQEDFQSILAGLGKAISSVPEEDVMGVYDEMSRLAGQGSGIPMYLFQKQSPADAMAAYTSLMQFKDTVRAYQPDAIGAAAAKFAKESYPFIKEVPWNSQEFLLTPGAADPLGWADAIGRIIDMGASMDGGLVKAGCQAHHAAIKGLSADGVCSEAELMEIYAAIGRMVASVPESKTMGVYTATKPLVDPKVPEYLMSKVTEANAKAAYQALIDFTTVVKANPIRPLASASTVSSSASGSISAAAMKLGQAAYPFMQGVNWMDDLYQKPVPGKSAQEVMKAVDKMIVMGSEMDWPSLQEAGRAHVAAIVRKDAAGVLTQGDFQSILAGLGKAISSVPESTVMGVYDEMGKLAGESSGIPANLFQKQTPADAMAAYGAVMQFKDTVRAYQPDAIGAAAAKLSSASYPFIKQVPWNSQEFLLTPGAANPIGWAGAISKIIDMGASMDGELVKAGCQAHHAAIKGLPADGVCSQAQMTEIYSAIGRMIASVPESKTMGVYDAVQALVDPKVPEYLMSKVSEADAKAAYQALLEFVEVVKANPITPSTSATTVSSSDASSISAAASELAGAAYPFMQGVDWTDDLYQKPVGKSAQEVLKAVDRMIVMGSEMDWPSLQEAAKAHVAAIEKKDAEGVLTQGDFQSILAGLGKAISSVPESTVMGVFSAMVNVAGRYSGIPANLYQKQDPTNASAAYAALMNFKDTVRSAQPAPQSTAKADDGLVSLLAALGGIVFILPTLGSLGKIVAP